tara:strand:+ start:2216 stop:2788 length:573 start_codon:yes stop_codon:yes gene_type:complete
MDKLNLESNCFFEKYGRNFEGYYNDIRIQKIMGKASRNYLGSFSPEEAESVKLIWLWKAVQKFDKEKFPDIKFTSYLFNQVVYGFKIELKKIKKEKRMLYLGDIAKTKELRSGGSLGSSGATPSNIHRKNTTSQNAVEFLRDLPQDVQSILSQRYIYNMTMEEIGAKNGYSRETARRRINSALDFCRNID